MWMYINMICRTTDTSVGVIWERKRTFYETWLENLGPTYFLVLYLHCKSFERPMQNTDNNLKEKGNNGFIERSHLPCMLM